MMKIPKTKLRPRVVFHLIVKSLAWPRPGYSTEAQEMRNATRRLLRLGYRAGIGSHTAIIAQFAQLLRAVATEGLR